MQGFRSNFKFRERLAGCFGRGELLQESCVTLRHGIHEFFQFRLLLGSIRTGVELVLDHSIGHLSAGSFEVCHRERVAVARDVEGVGSIASSHMGDQFATHSFNEDRQAQQDVDIMIAARSQGARRIETTSEAMICFQSRHSFLWRMLFKWWQVTTLGEIARLPPLAQRPSFQTLPDDFPSLCSTSGEHLGPVPEKHSAQVLFAHLALEANTRHAAVVATAAEGGVEMCDCLRSPLRS